MTVCIIYRKADLRIRFSGFGRFRLELLEESFLGFCTRKICGYFLPFVPSLKGVEWVASSIERLLEPVGKPVVKSWVKCDKRRLILGACSV